MWQSSESGEFSLPNLMARCHKEKWDCSRSKCVSGRGWEIWLWRENPHEHGNERGAPRPNGEARGGRARPDTPVAPLPPPHSRSHNKHSATCMAGILPRKLGTRRLRPAAAGWLRVVTLLGQSWKGTVAPCTCTDPSFLSSFKLIKKIKPHKRWIKYPKMAQTHKLSLKALRCFQDGFTRWRPLFHSSISATSPTSSPSAWVPAMSSSAFQHSANGNDLSWYTKTYYPNNVGRVKSKSLLMGGFDVWTCTVTLWTPCLRPGPTELSKPFFFKLVVRLSLKYYKSRIPATT